MPLLRLENLSLAYGHLPLLLHVDLQIDAGERVCLVGRNGTGKTTLFRVFTGVAIPDEGDVRRMDTLRIAHLEQEVPPDTDQTIFEVVAGGIGELGTLLTEYHNLTQRDGLAQRESLRELAELQARIEMHDGWNINQKVETVLTRLNLPEDKRVGGLFRRNAPPSDACAGAGERAGFATARRADQPFGYQRDHLAGKISAQLQRRRHVHHPRPHVRAPFGYPDRRVGPRQTRFRFPAILTRTCARKTSCLEIEERANAKFDKKLAEEETWIRRGIKARRTRNEGRVQRAASDAPRKGATPRGPGNGALRHRRRRVCPVSLVVDVRQVSFRFGDEPIIRDLSTRILRGDRVGIIGPNGSGKSTLLRLILGELEPSSGEVVLGTKLQVAYFDQHRRTLDVEKSVRENMSDSDYVTVRGRSRHVIGYLKDFLFPPERIDSPVKALSGGERNRLLLAKIFTQSANMMVLDEPTNDLDVDTLELLEELLAEYEGTLLLVSHDRTFLDNVVTSTLVFEGEGRFREYAGGYEDWERYQRSIPEVPIPGAKGSSATAISGQPEIKPSNKPRKLSYKERRELEALPAKIEALETEQAELHERMGHSAFYRQPGDQITSTIDRLEAVKRELEESYERWQTLESIAS